MLSAALLVLVVLVTSLPLSDAEFTLTLLHTNDVHARYEEFNELGSQCSAQDLSEGQCFGGFARLATAVKDYRRQFPDSLLLDGGDQYQGTLYFLRYGGNITQHFMNLLGYDAMAIGNHEFDSAVSGLVPFLRSVSFPVVSANIDSSNEPLIDGLFTKSVLLTVAGRTVGIVGYTTVDTPAISATGPNLQFDDVLDSVRAEVVRLQGEGVDIIIALGHAGYTRDRQVADIPGVDVVIGGHSNTFLYTGEPPSSELPVGPYPYVTTQSGGRTAVAAQCFTMGKYLCRLEVTFNDQGDVTSFSGNPKLLDTSVTPDPATVLELNQPWMQGVANLSRTEVGRTLVKLEGDRTVCRVRECNMGNLITDGMVFKNLRNPGDLSWNDASISILNSGTIRSSVGRGDILVADVLTVLPFSNTIDAITIRGKYLRAALEHSVSRLDPCNTGGLFGGFLQVSGLRMKYNRRTSEGLSVVAVNAPSTQCLLPADLLTAAGGHNPHSLRVKYNLRNPVGSRVVAVDALCTQCLEPTFEPLQDDAVYKVIIASFLRNGGSGFSSIGDNIIEFFNIGDLDADVFSEYLQALPAIYPAVEGRIQFLDRSDECGVPSSEDKPLRRHDPAWFRRQRSESRINLH